MHVCVGGGRVGERQQEERYGEWRKDIGGKGERRKREVRKERETEERRVKLMDPELA